MKYLLLISLVVLGGCVGELFSQGMAKQDQAEDVLYEKAEGLLCLKMDVDDAMKRYGKTSERFASWAKFCGHNIRLNSSAPD